jgi:transcriptional regulator with XRE-family HTH domain
MDEQPDEASGASGVPGRGEVPEVLADGGDSGRDDVAEAPELPLLPGFREMALRRMSAERRRLVADLTAQRRSAGLSQTEVAARMGTSQSAVARLETGDADVRVSTLERYAAAIGSQVAWQARPGRAQPGEDHPGLERADRGHPGQAQPDLMQPESPRAGQGHPGQAQPELTQPESPRAGSPRAGSPQAAPRQAELGQEYR